MSLRLSQPSEVPQVQAPFERWPLGRGQSRPVATTPQAWPPASLRLQGWPKLGQRPQEVGGAVAPTLSRWWQWRGQEGPEDWLAAHTCVPPWAIKDGNAK